MFEASGEQLCFINLMLSTKVVETMFILYGLLNLIFYLVLIQLTSVSDFMVHNKYPYFCSVFLGWG